jgi:hypothetical protein
VTNVKQDEPSNVNHSISISNKHRLFLFDRSKDKTPVSNVEAQEKVLQRYVDAIQYGLAILDTHFERVDRKRDNDDASFMHDADDNDDDDTTGMLLEPILEPKDPYIFRPLPHLIGTPEFMQDNYVGLGDLLTMHDDDIYDVQQIEPIETHSVTSSFLSNTYCSCALQMNSSTISDDDDANDDGQAFVRHSICVYRPCFSSFYLGSANVQGTDRASWCKSSR